MIGLELESYTRSLIRASKQSNGRKPTAPVFQIKSIKIELGNKFPFQRKGLPGFTSDLSLCMIIGIQIL